MNALPQTKGSWLALLAAIAGIVMPYVPPQYQLLAQAAIAGVGTFATYLP